jgi:thioredoxin-related protein
MKNFKITILIALTVSVSCQAQDSATEPVRWMSFEEAVAKNEKEPKKIFFDIYTNWCGWCKKMDASTFKDMQVVRYMNENYYAVKLNAETKDTIHFKDKVFVFKAEYKANELALSLLSGKMSYPSFVFMDEKYQLLSPVAGYLKTNQLMPMLTFFGENIYLQKSWEDYLKSQNHESGFSPD